MTHVVRSSLDPCDGGCATPRIDLDPISDTAAAIDCRGGIVSVNDAWAAAAVEGGSSVGGSGPGTNYLDTCDRARGHFTGGAASAAAGIRAVLSGEEDSFSLDYPCPADGVDRWFTMRVTPVGDACIGAIITHHDITDLKAAELTVRDGVDATDLRDQVATNTRSPGQVRRIARRLETQLLQTVPVSVMVMDDSGIIVYWNEVAASLSGRSSDEVVGRRIDELGLGPTRTDQLQDIQHSLSATGRWEGEFDGRRADGSVVSVHSTVEQVDDAAHDFHGVMVTTIDISERRRLEESLPFQALHDDLTGLPRRRLLVDHLGRALARNAGRSATWRSCRSTSTTSGA